MECRICWWPWNRQRKPYEAVGARAIAGCRAFPGSLTASLADSGQGSELGMLQRCYGGSLMRFWVSWCRWEAPLPTVMASPATVGEGGGQISI